MLPSGNSPKLFRYIPRLLLLVAAFGGVEVSFADCISLIKGNIAMDVKSCGVLNPEATFDTSQSRFRFVRELPPRDRKRFWDSYRGLVIKGHVAGSEAVRSGLTQEKGALRGESIAAFVHPNTSSYSCQKLMGQRIKAFVDEACCEGGGNPPCLLNSTYVLRDIGIIGNSTQKVESQASATSVSKIQLKGEALVRGKNYKKAVIYLEKARGSGALDMRGHYLLGYSYRQMDRCQDAIQPLDYIAQASDKAEFWANDDQIMRKGKLLLARCYAKLNKPEIAVPILETFLLEPQKFRPEISESLSHKDFNWIHTTKEFTIYRDEAVKVLNKGN